MSKGLKSGWVENLSADQNVDWVQAFSDCEADQVEQMVLYMNSTIALDNDKLRQITKLQTDQTSVQLKSQDQPDPTQTSGHALMGRRMNEKFELLFPGKKHHKQI